MTKKQYRTAIKQLGLSQSGAGRFLKVGERTSRRWALGETRVPSRWRRALSETDPGLVPALSE